MSNLIALDLELHLVTDQPDFRVRLAEAIQRHRNDPDATDYLIKFCKNHGHTDLLPATEAADA